MCMPYIVKENLNVSLRKKWHFILTFSLEVCLECWLEKKWYFTLTFSLEVCLECWLEKKWYFTLTFLTTWIPLVSYLSNGCYQLLWKSDILKWELHVCLHRKLLQVQLRWSTENFTSPTPWIRRIPCTAARTYQYSRKQMSLFHYTAKVISSTR